MIYTYFLIFRLDESIGSPSSSGAGISNGSSGAAEKISIRWDNFNNNNHSSTRISNNNTNIQNAVANSNSPASQQALVINNSNNCMGMYSGASSLSGDNMSIGSITDIPGRYWVLKS